MVTVKTEHKTLNIKFSTWVCNNSKEGQSLGLREEYEIFIPCSRQNIEMPCVEVNSTKRGIILGISGTKERDGLKRGK